MTSKAENMEQIYQTWKANGQVQTKTISALKELGFEAVSRQTLSKWIKDNGWEERAAREAAETEHLENATSEDVVLSELTDQKDRYIAYFKALPTGKIDTQATYAYVSLVNAIRDYKIKMLKNQVASEVDEAIRNQGLSDDTVAEIRNKILGL